MFNKIEILGLPGSGKTTLIQNLSSKPPSLARTQFFDNHAGKFGSARVSNFSRRKIFFLDVIRNVYSMVTKNYFSSFIKSRNKELFFKLLKKLALRKSLHKIWAKEIAPTIEQAVFFDSGLFQPILETYCQMSDDAFRGFLLHIGLMPPLPNKIIYLKVEPDVAVERELKRQIRRFQGMNHHELQRIYLEGSIFADKLIESLSRKGLQTYTINNTEIDLQKTQQKFWDAICR